MAESSPCDIVDPFLSRMRKDFGHIKLSDPQTEPFNTKVDTLVVTPEALDSLDDDALRYRIGRLLIIVAHPVPDHLLARIEPFYRQYHKAIGYTVFSRNRPGLQI